MSHRLRILQVSTSDGGGGAEQVAMNLHLGFQCAGAEAWMAVGYRRTASPDVFPIDNDRARGFLRSKVVVAGELLARRLGGTAGGAVRDLAMGITAPHRLIETLRGREDFAMPATRRLLSLPPYAPEVLHCHNLHGGYFDLRELAPLSHRLPVFLTLHDMWSFTGHCAYSLGCERWAAGCGACPDLGLSPALRRDGSLHNLELKRAIYRRSRLRVASPSRWLIDKARKSALAEGTVEWKIIPYGVNLELFHPRHREEARARLELSQDARVLLYAANAGRANPFKDYETVERAAADLSTRLGDRLVLLVVGGDGPPRQRGPIRFVPRLEDRGDLADHYRAADLFLHAAREDNFPNTVLESLACGTPVIATAVGGVAEQIEHGTTGFLVPPADPAAMAEAAVRALRDESALRAMRARSAELARERFDMRRHVRDYLQWFEDVVRADTAASSRPSP